MDFFEILAVRRSVRRYADRPVSEDDIKMMLSAALNAPSSKNTRSSEFMVVENRKTITALSLMRDSGSGFLENAPLVILVAGDATKADLWKVNASISATYLQLAVESLGLGSCWVQVAGRLRESARPDGETAEDYVRSLLSIPDRQRILCAIAIGHKESEVSRPRAEHPEDAQRVRFIK